MFCWQPELFVVIRIFVAGDAEMPAQSSLPFRGGEVFSSVLGMCVMIRYDDGFLGPSSFARLEMRLVALKF